MTRPFWTSLMSRSCLLVLMFTACGDSDPVVMPGFDSLVELTTEEPGENCEFGGQRITVGVDDGLNAGGQPAGSANDGVLDPGEITGLSFLCNILRLNY